MEYGVGRYFESIVERFYASREEGREEGLQKGIQEEKQQTIFRLFDMKFPEEEIAKIVAYPLEMIIRIKNERYTNMNI